MTEKQISYKMLDANFKCRDFQYEVGKTYTMDVKAVNLCNSGFHSCLMALDCFGFYPPSTSRFAEVEVAESQVHDNKLASATITIKAELYLPQFIQKGVDYILAHITDSKTEVNTGDQSAATNTGNRSAATNTGDQSAATNTGYQSAATNTGDQSAATNTGDQSAATNTGDQSAATNTGNRSAATNTGNRSAATNTGYRSAATNTGDRSAATNTGDRSAATNTGYRSAATVEGKYSVAVASGCQGRARASLGSAIVLVERDSDTWEILHVYSAITKKRGKIKPDTWYTLENGKPVKVEK